MNQPTLFDVPKDSPSKRQTLNAFKKANGIETHHCPGIEAPWTALHMPSAKAIREDREDTFEHEMGEYFAHYGSTLEDSGVAVCGDSERDVIRRLCYNLGIPCPL